MLLRFIALGAAAGAIAVASPATAAWHKAETRHFIIYADERPETLRDFAVRLEKFDTAVRKVRLMQDPPVGDGNRLTIFVLRNGAAVRRLLGDKSGFVEGYYIGRASGPVAFVPRDTGGNSADDGKAETVFLHEYAHHLMMQALDRPLPAWLVEGFAEFLSTARFPKDGSVVLGAAALHRQWGLYERDGALTFEQLLGTTYSKIDSEQRESIYALGWLLVHYLTFDPARAGQLTKYVDLIAAGAEPLAAARTAFGDLRKLQSEALRYMNRATLKALIVDPQQLGSPAVQISALSPGASQVITAYAQSRSGVDDQKAQQVVAQVRAVQQRYPGDELVELALAEAEIDAGFPEAAKAAAQRALAADPRNTDAMVLKGRAIVELADKAGDKADAMYEEARRVFIAANKVDTEDPDPLFQYYSTYAAQRRMPTASAMSALHYAASLAPQDEQLRMTSAYVYLHQGKLAEARRALVPLAFDPHGEDNATRARKIIAAIDKGDAKAAIAAAEAD